MLLECWLRRRAGAAASCCCAAPAGVRSLLSLPLERSLQEHRLAAAVQKVHAVCFVSYAAYLSEIAGLQHLPEQQGLPLGLLCPERCFLQASPALCQQ